MESGPFADAEEQVAVSVDDEEQPVPVRVEAGHPRVRWGRSAKSFHPKPNTWGERPASQPTQHPPARVSNQVHQRQKLSVPSRR
jgi:hypothetical protein